MDLFISILSGVCMALGGILLISGAVGVLRFSDFYNRLHAAGVTDTLAASLILFGLMLLSEHSGILLKLILILLFVLLTSPTASHALAKAAWKAGLKPDTSNDKPGQ
ncbi:monovalent cation/H(+) antiporter subunit G [Neptunicella marina]|uniref:Monovalent cation/H(+) antiporter subunit G n=1 Tax=Neptunicella marina TaxID=2125989 RepID=A0A8J6ITC3_9ALTE|nr:monovalent cation/H(+) antiporter subunit G [Neptunicella marina]MBC3765512.1 monovalent cation/H(+) antiporter subunit G [Neptunicella marina]